MNENITTELNSTLTDELLDSVDVVRQSKNGLLDEKSRGRMGQFMTPASVARLLANKFINLDGHISVLDAGAGVGSLTAALTQRALNEFRASHITANAWEIDDVLIEGFNSTAQMCQKACQEKGVRWTSRLQKEDFLESGIRILEARAHNVETVRFNKAVLNPPYLKISSNSRERNLLRKAGVETGNLYSCFVSLALKLLDNGGELVAITPRSFCNGPYFSDFRRVLLENNSLCKLHVFESRTKAFKHDKVLQENVIFHIIKGQPQGDVEIASSCGAEHSSTQVRISKFEEVINPLSSDRFFHIITSEADAKIAARVGSMPCTLKDLGISVSTGRVVDFRTRENLRQDYEDGTVPLIYPSHFKNGKIKWPLEGSKKPNALARNPNTESLLVPNGTYVLVKRLSAKEEPRRISAALFVKKNAGVDMVGFDNKTNYFHESGRALEYNLARGLCAYLNSTLVDQYFRQFNGHTQVNATDLRTLRYPSATVLVELGRAVQNFNQKHLDELV